ncbi:hypothetical protein J6590_025424 [Homalodisca vitripennis]|nr:hypothetical protein J6590_025424 [Homalodisca vitripennis]
MQLDVRGAARRHSTTLIDRYTAPSDFPALMFPASPTVTYCGAGGLSATGTAGALEPCPLDNRHCRVLGRTDHLNWHYEAQRPFM